MPWPGRDRSALALDALVFAWVVAWVIVGLRVGNEVDGLRTLSETVSTSGGAIEQTGKTLQALDVPFVGGEIDRIATQVTDTGRDTRLGGREARESISALSTLLAIAVAGIPSSFLLVVYVPLRTRRIRERRALRRMLQRAGEDMHVERLLAHRALQTLSYERLDRLGGRPWEELTEGEYARLAAAERSRLGLEPPRG